MIDNENKGLGRMRISLFEIYQEIIDEVLDFNNIKTYPLITNHEGYEFEAELSDGSYVDVYIYAERTRIGRFEVAYKFKNAENVVNFGFEIGPNRLNSQLSKNSYKTYIRIIATVGKALTKFINQNKPDIITLFSDIKHGGKAIDPQKDNIYFAALEKNPINGYEMESVYDSVDHKKGIMLYSKDKFK